MSRVQMLWTALWEQMAYLIASQAMALRGGGRSYRSLNDVIKTVTEFVFIKPFQKKSGHYFSCSESAFPDLGRRAHIALEALFYNFHTQMIFNYPVTWRNG